MTSGAITIADTIVESAEVRLLRALRALGSRERAEQEKRYQKSRWEHWGVPLPSMDVAIKETVGDLSPEQALDLCRRLWREPVWDLKIVAGRILARKSIAPDAKAWGFVTERLIDLDGWAVAGGDAADLAVAEGVNGLRQRELHNPHREPAWVQRSAPVRAIARREPGVSQTLWAAAGSSYRTRRRDGHEPSANSLDRDSRIPVAIS
jgi:DNA alkylation repair enzyme